MYERNLNGIGRTVITRGDDIDLEIRPQEAERALAVIDGANDEEYEDLFSTFARKEADSIEGRIVALGTDRNQTQGASNRAPDSLSDFQGRG